MSDSGSGASLRGSAVPRSLSSGPMVLGKYETFASLGSGGMADVFLAIARGPKGFNKLIVVKTLKPEFVREPSFV